MFEWNTLKVGEAYLEISRPTIICGLNPVDTQSYHDAQIYDYAGLKRRHFPWRPPLRMRVRAWTSDSVEKLRGTAGFGFWNQPFMPGQASMRLPRAIWYFLGSPPSNMALAKDIPGFGWKAATFNASNPFFFGLLPFAPLGFLAMRNRFLYNRLWPIGQRAIGVSEYLLTISIEQPHTYEIVWRTKSAQFFVDGDLVHESFVSPKGPLGFIAWMDNQYAVVTPQGQFKFGFVSVEKKQWLALDSIEIESLKE